MKKSTDILTKILKALTIVGAIICGIAALWMFCRNNAALGYVYTEIFAGCIFLCWLISIAGEAVNHLKGINDKLSNMQNATTDFFRIYYNQILEKDGAIVPKETNKADITNETIGDEETANQAKTQITEE